MIRAILFTALGFAAGAIVTTAGIKYPPRPYPADRLPVLYDRAPDTSTAGSGTTLAIKSGSAFLVAHLKDMSICNAIAEGLRGPGVTVSCEVQP